MTTTSTADTEQQLRQLRDRIRAATEARIRAEHSRDAAKAQADRARQALADEFGVHTVADAKTMHAALTDQLHAGIADLNAALERIGE